MPADRSDAACTVHHNDGNIRSCCFALRQKLKAGHSRHVDVGKDPDQRCPRRITGLTDVALCPT